MTDGQRKALRQLEAVAAGSDGALELVEVAEPSPDDARLRVDVSLDCSAIEQSEAGIRLRQREPLRIYVQPGFPWAHPSVRALHRRWAGTPHVQWARYLCLYQAPTVEWQPHDGILGFLERLNLWLRRAAVGELDPVGGPLHPPAVYATGSAPRLIVRANAPPVENEPWIGFARIERKGPARIDLVGWTDEIDGDSNDVAPAVLLAEPMDWEYPQTVRGLLDALAESGVRWRMLLALLRLGSLRRAKDDGLPLVVGTPMRRGHDGELKQHLVAWYLSDVIAEGLRFSLASLADDDELRKIGEKVEQIIRDWADQAEVAWCQVSELRDEIVERRDSLSSVRRAFESKSVVIWGCGAIGAHAALWIARAGARRIVLYDKSTISPGILARQPYVDGEVGEWKAEMLAKRLREIDPELEIEPRAQNVLTGPLDRDDWHDGTDVVIDATAAVSVASKLESVRRRAGAGATTLIAMLFGHTAEHGVGVVLPAGQPASSVDALRRVKLECTRSGELRGFADEFWPDPPRTDHFQPEPGCSDATFRGSAAEVAALTGELLTCAAAEIAADNKKATAHLTALATAKHERAVHRRFEWEESVVVADGLGRYQVRIAPPALRSVRAWIARNVRIGDPSHETGGVLFGQRDMAAGVLWIDEAYGPPPDSVASAEEFVCGTDGVAELAERLKERSRSSSSFIGMWHTHPGASALPSPRDVASMARLVSMEPLPEVLALIVGRPDTAAAELGAYVFARAELPQPFGVLIIEDRRKAAPSPLVQRRDVGLALSGGGSRAIAFHLGCMRALRDRGVLDRVRVVSGVSGGAVAAATYAYGDGSFDDFDARLHELLRRGLEREILRRSVLHPRAASALTARVVSGAAAIGARAFGRVRRSEGVEPPIRRWATRTDGFEATLSHRLFGSRTLDAERRDDIDTVINSCDLRTGSAMRFGSRESGTWRLGRIDDPVRIATAVAASAAYPLLLPSIDRRFRFEDRDGQTRQRRVVLSDGGIFDNLGTSCLEPGRSSAHSYNVFPVDYIVACDAGRGLLADAYPVGAVGRLGRSFEAAHRKVQDAARSRLHSFTESGDLAGFVMPYLGQQDRRLPWAPTDLVPRRRVVEYPTNFAPMPAEELEALARRGEQLTQVLIEIWCPDL